MLNYSMFMRTCAFFKPKYYIYNSFKKRKLERGQQKEIVWSSEDKWNDPCRKYYDKQRIFFIILFDCLSEFEGKFVVANNHLKLIGINFIGILNYVKKSWFFLSSNV